ncbi:MAG: hypothetical protein IPM82_17935 [Saprospiraceae bacterium]|nr:hypothetical protein [Saprospiraceae bacterium]
MVEVTIRTENEAALQKLLEFISTIGFQVVGKKQVKNGKSKPAVKPKEKSAPPPEPPITWAKEPEKAAEMFGIWKGKEIDPEELRKEAWGGRL